MYALFLTPNKKAYVWVTDTVRTNRMANLNTLYNKEHGTKYYILINNYMLFCTLNFVFLEFLKDTKNLIFLHLILPLKLEWKRKKDKFTGKFKELFSYIGMKNEGLLCW